MREREVELITVFTQLFIEDLLLVMSAAGDEDDDVFDDVSTSLIDVDADSPAHLDRSRHHQHHHTWSEHGTEPPAGLVEDRLRDASEDQRPSTAGTSASVDVERRQSGFQRRRLGQLQLKHRLAVDLPDQSSPVRRGSRLEEESAFITNGLQATSVVSLAAQNELILKSVWNTLDDSDFQFYVAFIIAVATMAVALNVPPAWLMLAVAGLSLLHFSIDER